MDLAEAAFAAKVPGRGRHAAETLVGNSAMLRVFADGVTGLPAYAYPEDAARALGHAARYRAWRERRQGRIPELSGLRAADARKLLAGFLAGCPAGGWLPAAAPLLSGHQGTPPVDTTALADALLRVSRLADDLPEVAELTLSPVVAGPDGVCAVGVRVWVSPAEPRDPFPAPPALSRQRITGIPPRLRSRWSIRADVDGTDSGVAIWCGRWPGRSGHR